MIISCSTLYIQYLRINILLKQSLYFDKSNDPSIVGKINLLLLVYFWSALTHLWKLIRTVTILMKVLSRACTNELLFNNLLGTAGTSLGLIPVIVTRIFWYKKLKLFKNLNTRTTIISNIQMWSIQLKSSFSNDIYNFTFHNRLCRVVASFRYWRKILPHPIS